MGGFGRPFLLATVGRQKRLEVSSPIPEGKRRPSGRARFVPDLDSKLPAIDGLSQRVRPSRSGGLPLHHRDGAGRRSEVRETVAWRRAASFKLDALAL